MELTTIVTLMAELRVYRYVSLIELQTRCNKLIKESDATQSKDIMKKYKALRLRIYSSDEWNTNQIERRINDMIAEQQRSMITKMAWAYKVLRMSRAETKASSINKVYHELAKVYHPDRQSDGIEKANELMQNINAARDLIVENVDFVNDLKTEIVTTMMGKDRKSVRSNSSPRLSDQFYEVDRVVNMRNNKKTNKIVYRVRWFGYPPAQDSWESEEELIKTCPSIVNDFFIYRMTKSRVCSNLLKPGTPTRDINGGEVWLSQSQIDTYMRNNIKSHMHYFNIDDDVDARFKRDKVNFKIAVLNGHAYLIAKITHYNTIFQSLCFVSEMKNALFRTDESMKNECQLIARLLMGGELIIIEQKREDDDRLTAFATIAAALEFQDIMGGDINNIPRRLDYSDQRLNKILYSFGCPEHAKTESKETLCAWCTFRLPERSDISYAAKRLHESIYHQSKIGPPPEYPIIEQKTIRVPISLRILNNKKL